MPDLPDFVVAHKRLRMRYAIGTYTFNRVKPTAGEDQIWNLASNLTALQNETPQQIITVVTRLLV